MLTLMLGLECLEIFWNAHKQGLFRKWMLSLQDFSAFAQKKCLTASLYLKIFPAWDCFSPTVGTDQSQCGNKLFPSWESDILRFFCLLIWYFFLIRQKKCITFILTYLIFLYLCSWNVRDGNSVTEFPSQSWSWITLFKYIVEYG